MTAKIIDGRAVASIIKQKVAEQVAQRLQQNLSPPGLAVILVGNDPASISYVRHKQNACAQVKIVFNCHHLPYKTTQTQIAEVIKHCNQDPNVHGILLQLPLPQHINTGELLELIDPRKDVDGFHPYNMGRLVQRKPTLRPCTSFGVMRLLDTLDIDLSKQHAVVLSASNSVGRPMALELLLAKSTVTICHRFTQNLDKHVKSADILIAAIGKPNIVKSEWIKPGAVVIDVGFNLLPDGKISGDIEFETAKIRAGWITPVPGGVGQMTVATLLENTLFAANQM